MASDHNGPGVPGAGRDEPAVIALGPSDEVGGEVYVVVMDILNGTMVQARRIGWDGSLIDAPDGPFAPSDRADEFADVEGFDPDTDVVDIEPVEGVLHFWDYANGTKTRYVVVTDTGGQFSVDPDTIQAL
jgi:hypothetical protein